MRNLRCRLLQWRRSFRVRRPVLLAAGAGTVCAPLVDRASVAQSCRRSQCRRLLSPLYSRPCVSVQCPPASARLRPRCSPLLPQAVQAAIIKTRRAKANAEVRVACPRLARVALKPSSRSHCSGLLSTRCSPPRPCSDRVLRGLLRGTARQKDKVQRYAFLRTQVALSGATWTAPRTEHDLRQPAHRRPRTRVHGCLRVSARPTLRLSPTGARVPQNVPKTTISPNQTSRSAKVRCYRGPKA